ncbi:MAG: hypothetical protein ACE5FA_12735, partial [Dehalococcoidia bacterium]
SSIGSGPAPIPITSSAAQGKIGSAANENILVHAGEVVKVRDGRMAEIVPADRAGTIPVTRSAAGGVTFTDRPFVSNVLPGEGFNEQSVKFSPDASATIGTPSVPVTSPPETTAPTATPGTVDTTPDIAGTIEFVLSSLQSDGLLNRDRLIQNLSRLQRLGNNPASFNIQKAIARLGANDLQGAIGELAGAATLFGAAQEQPKQGSIPIASPKPLSDPTGAKNVPLPTMTPAQRRRMLELGIDPRDPDALDQLKAAAANPDIVPVGQFDFSSNPDLQDLYDQYQAVLTGGAFAGGFTAKKKLLESMTAALGQEFADSIGWDGDRFSVADAFRNLNGYFGQFKQTQESFDAAVKTAQSGDAGGGDANGGADGGQDTDGTGATDEPTAEEAFLANQGFDPTDQEAFDTMKQLLEDILAGKTRTDNPLPEETLFGVNLGSPSLIAPTLNKLDSASQGILLSAMAFRLGITVDQLLREFVYPNTPNAVPITSSFVRAA